jgi:5-methylcytosine-specific restriction protein A
MRPPHVYVDSDVPPGQRLDDWRRDHRPRRRPQRWPRARAHRAAQRLLIVARRALGVCSHPGCPNIGCEEHARGTARQRGYDAKWERTRRAFLAANPDCVRCGAPATEAHHRDGLGPLGPNGHEHWNLEALCKSHHSSETASTRDPGG